MPIKIGGHGGDRGTNKVNEVACVRDARAGSGIKFLVLQVAAAVAAAPRFIIPVAAVWSECRGGAVSVTAEYRNSAGSAHLNSN